MSDKNQRSLALLALACGACLNFGASSGPDQTTVEVTPPRVLDGVCAQHAYALAGVAVRRAGLTPDSCGFELGPGDGSVTFSTSGSPDATGTLGDTTEFRALVVDLDGGAHGARWITLTPASDSTAGTAEIPDPNATTSVKVSSGGGHLGLLDLEAKVSIPPYSGGCSVARSLSVTLLDATYPPRNAPVQSRDKIGTTWLSRPAPTRAR